MALTAIALFLLITAFYVYREVKQIKCLSEKSGERRKQLKVHLNSMDSRQIDAYLKYKKDHYTSDRTMSILIWLGLFSLMTFSAVPANAQAQTHGSFWTEGGGLITVVLISLPILAGFLIMLIKISNLFKVYQDKQRLEKATQLAEYLKQSDSGEIDMILSKRKQALDFTLSHRELSGELSPEDMKGILQQVNTSSVLPVVAAKKRAAKRPAVDPVLSKLILWFIGTAAFWLIFGTTVGEYLGIKFVAPNANQKVQKNWTGQCCIPTTARVVIR